MKNRHSIFLFVCLSFTGCLSQKVATDLDLNSEMSIWVVESGIEYRPPFEIEIRIEEIIKSWLPEMHSVWDTYPTPRYKLKVVGTSNKGSDYELWVFVGSNWIGDGVGVATLADTQAFRLQKMIESTIR